MKERFDRSSLQLDRESVSEIVAQEEKEKKSSGIKISPTGIDLLEKEDEPLTEGAIKGMVRGVAAHKVSELTDIKVVIEITNYQTKVKEAKRRHKESGTSNETALNELNELMQQHKRRLLDTPTGAFREFQYLLGDYYFKKVARGKNMRIIEGEDVFADKVENIWRSGFDREDQSGNSTREFLERVVKAEESLIDDNYIAQLQPGETPNVSYPVLAHAIGQRDIIREEMRINNVTINRLDGSQVKFQLVTVPDLMFVDGRIVIIDKKFGSSPASLSQPILYGLVAQEAFRQRGTKPKIELYEANPPANVLFYYQTLQENGRYAFSISNSGMLVENPVTWVADKVKEYKTREVEMKKRLKKRKASIVTPYLPTNKQKIRMEKARNMPQQPRLIYAATS